MLKKGLKLRNVVAGVICLAVSSGFLACGDGNKSGLKSNEFFGNLPALLADNDLAEQAGYEKLQKLYGDTNALLKEAQKQEKAKEKRRAAIDAEKEKVNGKEVPFAISNALKESNPNYSITGVKVSGSGLSVTYVAENVQRDIFGVAKNKISYRIIAEDGSTISAEQDTEVYGGVDAPVEFGVYITGNDALSVFASIEFITADEARTYIIDAQKNKN